MIYPPLLAIIVHVSRVTTEIKLYVIQYKYHCSELHRKVSF